jgi:hypothetical protein
MAILQIHPIIYAAVGCFLVIFLFVVVPAIWSTKPFRRRAASVVLRQLLDLIPNSNHQN